MKNNTFEIFNSTWHLLWINTISLCLNTFNSIFKQFLRSRSENQIQSRGHMSKETAEFLFRIDNVSLF